MRGPKPSIIPIAVGVVALLNFQVCARIVHSGISKLKTSQQPTAPGPRRPEASLGRSPGGQLARSVETSGAGLIVTNQTR